MQFHQRRTRTSDPQSTHYKRNRGLAADWTVPVSARSFLLQWFKASDWFTHVCPHPGTPVTSRMTSVCKGCCCGEHGPFVYRFDRLRLVHSTWTALSWFQFANWSSPTPVWTAALEYTSWTRWAPTVLVSLQPVKSWRWCAWPMNASCKWVDLLQVSSVQFMCCKRFFTRHAGLRQRGSHAALGLARRNTRCMQRTLGTASCSLSLLNRSGRVEYLWHHVCTQCLCVSSNKEMTWFTCA